MNKFKSGVMNMADYTVSQERGMIKLNQNESPSDVPEVVKEKVIRQLRLKNWNRYPVLNPVNIAERLAIWQNMPRHMVLPAPGSNALIQAVMLSVLNAGDKVLTLNPTFSVYQRVASVIGAALETISFNAQFELDEAELIRRAESVQMVLLANPNNPTGTLISRDTLRQVCRVCPGMVVIDEAYAEYSGVSMKEDISEYDNLVVLRTFSKAFSAAGVRLGYALAQGEVIHTLRKAMLPFSLNILQQAAFIELLAAADYFQGEILKVLGERDRLMESLMTMSSIWVVPSAANFILLCFPYNNAFRVWNLLQERGILVRYFDAPELESCLRVSIGNREENDLLVDNLKEILSGERH